MKILIIVFFIIAYLFIGVCVSAIDYSMSSNDYKELVDETYFRSVNQGVAVFIALFWPLYLVILVVWLLSTPFVWVYHQIVKMSSKNSWKTGGGRAREPDEQVECRHFMGGGTE